jgi:hypothetical protein
VTIAVFFSAIITFVLESFGCKSQLALDQKRADKIYWTMASIDTLVSIGAMSAFSLERFVAP